MDHETVMNTHHLSAEREQSVGKSHDYADRNRHSTLMDGERPFTGNNNFRGLDRTFKNASRGGVARPDSAPRDNLGINADTSAPVSFHRPRAVMAPSREVTEKEWLGSMKRITPPSSHNKPEPQRRTPQTTQNNSHTPLTGPNVRTAHVGRRVTPAAAEQQRSVVFRDPRAQISEAERHRYRSDDVGGPRHVAHCQRMERDVAGQSTNERTEHRVGLRMHQEKSNTRTLEGVWSGPTPGRQQGRAVVVGRGHAQARSLQGILS